KSIVFESNAFSVQWNDNLVSRGYHLYHLPYQTSVNDVVVPPPTSSGSTTNVLDYRTFVSIKRGDPDSFGQQAAAIDDRRIAFHADRNEYGALWVRGAAAGGANNGDILYTSADANFRNPSVLRATLPSALQT